MIFTNTYTILTYVMIIFFFYGVFQLRKAVLG